MSLEASSLTSLCVSDNKMGSAAVVEEGGWGSDADAGSVSSIGNCTADSSIEIPVDTINQLYGFQLLVWMSETTTFRSSRL